MSKKVPITARNAVHFTLVHLAFESHCGEKCITCTGGGKLWYPETDQHGPCPNCHGFGTRELKPPPPRYTFGIGAGFPSKHSIINMTVA